ncbi:hypothetical protein [Aminobacter sp. J44]|uniref:hypothetical protein n=1 Tax=Aminobacter sp. J44 TaxID=935262 RepID=UPI00119BB970|nr:hypothetical protein [Aminobacter sp. J44]TWG63544.1 hypothetical protein L610_001900000750 [Aminobacter sp. J44]
MMHTAENSRRARWLTQPRRLVRAAVPAAIFALAGAATPALANDYPTVTVADYVFACMKANGETRRALESCSCSIDVISTIIPYEAYEQAETFRSLSFAGGERGAFFRESAAGKTAIGNLRRAQAEADVRCF